MRLRALAVVLWALLCRTVHAAPQAVPLDDDGRPMRPRWCGGAPSSVLPWNNSRVQLQLRDHRPGALVPSRPHTPRTPTHAASSPALRVRRNAEATGGMGCFFAGVAGRASSL
jgi:hypothetical protein